MFYFFFSFLTLLSIRIFICTHIYAFGVMLISILIIGGLASFFHVKVSL